MRLAPSAVLPASGCAGLGPRLVTPPATGSANPSQRDQAEAAAIALAIEQVQERAASAIRSLRPDRAS